MSAPQVLETDISSSRIYLQQEPSILVGNAANLSSRDDNTVDSLPSGNPGDVDLGRFPNHSRNANSFSNHYREHTISTPHGPPYTFFLENASSGPYIHTGANPICPSPMSPGNLVSSSTTGTGGVGVHQHSSSNDMVDISRGSCKRKSDEAPVANNCSVTASTSSNSVGASINLYHPPLEDPSGSVGGVCESLSLFQSEHRRNNRVPASGSSQRSVRSRSGSVRMGANRDVPSNNRFHQGNPVDQCPSTIGDETLTRFGNHSDGNRSNWSCFPVPFGLHGSLASTGFNANGGPTDVENQLSQVHPTVFGRVPAIVWHASPLHHLHPQVTSPIIYGHVPVPSNREAMTTGRIYQNIHSRPYDGLQLGHARYFQMVPMQQGGVRSSRSQRRLSYEQAPRFARNNNHVNLAAMLSSQNFRMPDFSGFYDAGGYVDDEYRDMRLDIDNMSYEELLALGERIGDVKTGLSEQSISKCLKTEKHISCTSSSTCNDCENHKFKTGTCIICQEHYQEDEEVGFLGCGHEFHAACVRQWLLIKNLCPICKSHAVATDEK